MSSYKLGKHSSVDGWGKNQMVATNNLTSKGVLDQIGSSTPNIKIRSTTALKTFVGGISSPKKVEVQISQNSNMLNENLRLNKRRGSKSVTDLVAEPGHRRIVSDINTGTPLSEYNGMFNKKRNLKVGTNHI